MNSTTKPGVPQIRDRFATLLDAANEAGQRIADCQHSHNLAVRKAVLDGNHSAADRTGTALDNAKRAFDRARELADAAEQELAEAKARERAEADAVARQQVEDALAEMATSARDADHLLASAAGILERLRAHETELHRFIRGTFGIDASPLLAPMIAATSAGRFGAFLRSVAANNRMDAVPWVESSMAEGEANIRRGLAQ